MTPEIKGEDLAANWSLSFDELALIGTKRISVRLRFALLLRFRQLKGLFPDDASENSSGSH